MLPFDLLVVCENKETRKEKKKEIDKNKLFLIFPHSNNAHKQYGLI